MKHKLLISLILIFTFFSKNSRADEGMWLPILLGQGPEAEMQRMGMKISAQDIFSVNKACIKDAICLFGGGCTAEIVSSQGLILTNHHCGYSAVQAHSSVDHDYLTNGFWASSFKEELANPSLKVSILTYMEDVTEKVLKDIPENLASDMRQSMIALRIAQMEQEAKNSTKNTVQIKEFFNGNQYILVSYKVFQDVRLVGAPPSRIGKFGGDTDNWMWPRQTGDFSLFRIYVDKDNNPAPYSESNIPYTPEYHLKISLKGVQENDFTFVFGYPGTTQEYLPSIAVDRLAHYENPVSIKARGIRLEVFRKYMEQDKKTRIQYSAKYAGVENYYKKMMGESKGVDRTEIISRKAAQEKQFVEWANATEDRKKNYGNIISNYIQLYKDYGEIMVAMEYFYEAGLGIEMIRYTRNYDKLLQLSTAEKINQDELSKYLDALKNGAPGFFKNYDSRIDKEVMIRLLNMYYNECNKEFIPSEVKRLGDLYKGDFSKFVDEAFTHSIFTDEKKLTHFLESYQPKKAKAIVKDPLFSLSANLYQFNKDVLNTANEKFRAQNQELNRFYMKGLMEMNPDKKFYPDANSTLRVAYGKVQGFEPRDGVKYKYFTTLKGVIEKEDSTIYDYVVDDRLKELYEKSDYGMYADKDGSMHVAFIATNHTTGGNSGSPVLNANGELIGINFDRVWEGTMSDIVYEKEICRNISLDIRYCLFVIDKYAGATHLIKEMDLVN